MNKKDLELQRTARAVDAPEKYSEFEDSVLQAAKAQADTIVAQAKQSGDELFASLTAPQRTDPLAAYRAEAASALRRRSAAARQENRRKLLVYRGQLVNGLFAEAQENLAAFTAGPDYESYVTKSLVRRAPECQGACTVYLREQDVQRLSPAVRKVLPDAQIAADRSIRLGGVKVAAGHLLFDETLDSAAADERTAFLGRCGLRVE